MISQRPKTFPAMFALMTMLGSAAAQDPPPAAPPTSQAQAAPDAPASAPSDATQRAVEQRIAALQAKLGITPAQQADWNAFAQVMRDNAASTDTAFHARAQGASTMNAVDNMNSYAAIARTYADNTQKLADSFSSFYGKLSAQQKQTADVLFRETPAPAAKHSRHRR